MDRVVEDQESMFLYERSSLFIKAVSLSLDPYSEQLHFFFFKRNPKRQTSAAGEALGSEWVVGVGGWVGLGTFQNFNILVTHAP